MEHQQALRDHVLELLRGGHAHLDFEKATAGLPAQLRGSKPRGLPFTPWRLVEHMRIAQWDILQFSIDPHHVSPDFPDGYWPPDDAPPDSLSWDQSIASFLADLKTLSDLISDPKTDLLAPLPHGKGQTILREALLAADHNAYHLGQLVVVRRLLGAWHDE
jgi:DinB superfamily